MDIDRFKNKLPFSQRIMEQLFKLEKSALLKYFTSGNAFKNKSYSFTSLMILIIWFLLVVFVINNHELWRDEVRALSMALQPQTIWQLPSVLKNEGHPALWYIVLRILYNIFRTPQVLKISNLFFAFGAIILFFRYAAFKTWFKLLFIFSLLPFYEYAIFARNYSISVFFLFLFTTLYIKEKKPVLSMAWVLFALANTNIHSTILSGLLLLIWISDLYFNRSIHVTNKNKHIIGFAISLLGIIGAILIVWPGGTSLIVRNHSFYAINHVMNNFIHLGLNYEPLFLYWPLFIRNIMLWLLIIGLMRFPRLALAQFLAIFIMGILSSIIYPTALRHQGLVFVFCLCLYWIAKRRNPEGSWSNHYHLIKVNKLTLFFILPILLIFQVQKAYAFACYDIRNPMSSSKAFAQIIHSIPELQNAIIISEPDYFIESLPYYLDNELYIPREEKFGHYTHYTTDNKIDFNINELLTIASQMHLKESKPILILLGFQDLFNEGQKNYRYPYGKNFTASPEEKSTFLSQTRKLASFQNSYLGEDYDLYLFLGTSFKPCTEKP